MSRSVPEESSFQTYVLDQLRQLGGVRSRRMFGGYGLYYDEAFFGIIYDGRLYYRTGERTRPEYERRGMERFRPNEKQTLKSYYEIPPEVLEDPRELAEWARKAAAGE